MGGSAPLLPRHKRIELMSQKYLNLRYGVPKDHSLKDIFVIGARPHI